MRIQYKPMVRFIWLGALVMALGGSWPSRTAATARSESTADDAVRASGTAPAR